MHYINTTTQPPFQVRIFGYIRNFPNHFTPGTKQSDVMLTLNMAGQGVYKYGSKRIIVKPNMVGLVPPNREGILYSDTDNPYDHYYCRFSGAYAHQLAESIIAKKGERFFIVQHMPRLIEIVKELPPIRREELPEHMGEYELALARILVLLSEDQPKRKTLGLTKHALHQYIELRQDRLIHLDEMAEHFNMTKPALCRAGKRLLGTTIVKYSNTLRVDAACQLLAMQTMNVTEVARRVGFEDPYYFSRVFKQAKGLSPKQWQLRSISD